jgi:hypothetical protein
MSTCRAGLAEAAHAPSERTLILRVDRVNACSAALFSCQAPWLEQIRARHEQDYQPPDNWQGCL